MLNSDFARSPSIFMVIWRPLLASASASFRPVNNLSSLVWLIIRIFPCWTWTANTIRLFTMMTTEWCCLMSVLITRFIIVVSAWWTSIVIEFNSWCGRVLLPTTKRFIVTIILPRPFWLLINLFIWVIGRRTPFIKFSWVITVFSLPKNWMGCSAWRIWLFICFSWRNLSCLIREGFYCFRLTCFRCLSIWRFQI